MAGNEITLYGSVGMSWWEEDYFTAKSVREKLSGMSGDIVVRLNSGGGIASEGQAIYTMLVDHPGKVTVIVDGVAASAASLIAMAGDEIVMRLGAWMLIHDPANPWTTGRGTEADHLKEAELLRVISGAYADIYGARAGMDREDARQIMRDETVMDGAMCVEKGFATSVDTAAPAIAAAVFDYRMYTNAPQDLRDASERLGATPAREAVMAMIAGHPKIVKHQEMTMSTNVTKAAAEVTPAVKPETAITMANPQSPLGAEATATALQAERARTRRIIEATAAAGLPADFSSDLIEKGMALEGALDAITAAWKAKGDVDTVVMAGRPTAHILRDERDTRMEAAEQALVAMIGNAAPKSDKAQPFMGMRLTEMAAEFIGHKGRIRTSGDAVRVVEMAMHSTSDFPVVLENALNKRLQETYAKATPTYREVAEQMDFNDFRPHPIAAIGDFPALQLVQEGGEIQFGTVGEKKETLFLRSYASGMGITRQMIINDDMRAIDRILATRGTTVALFEDNLFWTMFLSGANADGPTLTETSRQVFNTNAADNTKAGTATAITVPALGAGRAALRTRRSLPSAAGRTDGQLLNLNAQILLVGPDKETEAQQLVAPIQALQAGNVNPFAGMLRVIVSPYITGNAWYLLADPAILASFAYGLLNGETGPRMRMDEPFGVQGMRFTVEHDFGCGAIGFRAGWKNAGA
jgi:ATP-dependent protease ClpP protease subunit